ncbi:hypothetical protein BGW38_007578, partial [Lunasporangiospora selenospora]
MAKGDILTPPGTGYIDCLTPDQKKILKEVWSIIFSIADSGEVIVPPELKCYIQKDSLSEEAAGHEAGMAKISLQELGLSVDKLRPILWDNVMGDHPGIRELCSARKWNVMKALNMMFKAFKWRLDEDIPSIKYSTDTQLNELYPKFFAQLDSGKFYIHGTDYENRPVVYLHNHLHRPRDQPNKTLERLVVYVIEAGRALVQHPVETVCLVFDLTGTTLENLDYEMAKYLSSIFEAYYPESLGRIIYHGAPIVFWAVWKLVESWMDPVVASKVRFTKNDQDLTQYIPAEHLPDRYKGGRNRYTYKYIYPEPRENDCMNDTETKNRLVAEWKAMMWKFEALTREWIAAGTENPTTARVEEEIEAERSQLTKDLRAA